MPTGLPTPAQIWTGEISFVSIDTNLIQSAGYKFDQGALHQLPHQLPASMSLQLPEVVVREIIQHRMASVMAAVQQLDKASKDVRRLATIDMDNVDQAVLALHITDSARNHFRREIEDFARLCRGGVLPIAGVDATSDLFDSYFMGKPPFGQRKEKKSEFPDALCLWLLEKYAHDHNTKGIVASDDDGWSAYAEGSERLYRVKSIEELTSLFTATTEHSNAIKSKIAAMVSQVDSKLRKQLDGALRTHVANANWNASDVFSGVGRVEANAYHAEVEGYGFAGEINIWFVEEEHTTWVVELSAAVNVQVHLDIDFFIWDSIDREEMRMGSQASKSEDIEVEVFLVCSNVQLETSPDTWIIEVEIGDGEYSVEGFEAELDL